MKKGQMTLIGLVMAVAIVICFVSLLPTINYFVELGVNNSEGSTVQLIINLFPIFMALGILITIIGYMTFVYPHQ